MNDNDIIKALEDSIHKMKKCGVTNWDFYASGDFVKNILDLINRLEKTNRKNERIIELADKTIETQKAEIERLQSIVNAELDTIHDLGDDYERALEERQELVKTAKSEAIKELSEKITEIFMRYAHLHSYAEGARKDYIETVDGKEIEMQSVWDVITLQMNGIAEYEEMSRLQKNIEIIEKDRLLTELEKDFRLLIKEMTENDFKE